jgi:hypothetical protein
MKTPARCLAAGIAGTALLIVGPGAFAAAGATNVLSDKVTFTAQLVPNGPGQFTLQNQGCNLTSDGETQVFSCQISGLLTQTSPTTAGISTTVTSADGRTFSSARLTLSSTGSFLGKGHGSEEDAPDPGQPPPPGYPCIAKYSGTINAAMVMSGTLKMKESTTAP